MKKLPKEVYLHTFLIVLIFVAFITALTTYALVTAPIEHNQKKIVETVNTLIDECKFIEGSYNYVILYNLSVNLSITGGMK